MSKYFVAVFLVFTVVALAAAQSKTVSKQQSPQPLTLTARTDRQVYRMSEEITMETRLLNAGREDVYVWDWDFAGISPEVCPCTLRRKRVRQ